MLGSSEDGVGGAGVVVEGRGCGSGGQWCCGDGKESGEKKEGEGAEESVHLHIRVIEYREEACLFCDRKGKLDVV